MCPDKKRPAGNTCRIAKGLDAVWAHFCPSKPCLPLSTDGTFLNYTTAQPCMETLETLALLSAVFGAYFCCFVRTKLSSFYDENSVNIFYDGPFRMNVPGVKFNNRNWPHIVRTLRLSLCLCMILFPIINIVAGSIVADVWENIGKYVFLAMFLCGVLLPIYVVGKKYE